ncbi:unnamed protein product [Lepeophtheirus salmonis]|uniref:(salmon louse) hypothetical protein n=1 Tax=Lepeophtheirus salmonis TaxID=72036 RepID=A0A7R8DA94_LEPSM|nr:unnamed protein product [Lepeophtheirus salmonis]CAF3024427.1 unnamed protein product [Lepeophtheirus salmonis]
MRVTELLINIKSLDELMITRNDKGNIYSREKQKNWINSKELQNERNISYQYLITLPLKTQRKPPQLQFKENREYILHISMACSQSYPLKPFLLEKYFLDAEKFDAHFRNGIEAYFASPVMLSNAKKYVCAVNQSCDVLRNH